MSTTQTPIIPKLTEAGKAAALDASNFAVSLRLTHIGFGLGQYTPTGQETALFNEVARVPITGAMKPRPNQMRVAGAWDDVNAGSEVGEVGYYSGNILVAVASRPGAPLAQKTIGASLVWLADLAFTEVPAGSIAVIVNPDANEALSALVLHEVSDDAHTQYLLRSAYVDANALQTAKTVAGTANAITLRLTEEVALTEYKRGQQVTFVANAPNTGPVTVSVNGLTARQVRKNGTAALGAGDIVAGAPYTLFYDGAVWHLSGGAGSAGTTLNRYGHTATAGQTEFAAQYTPGAVLVYRNGQFLSPGSYTANDGEKVILPASTAGDKVEILAFRPFTMADTFTRDEANNRFALKHQVSEAAPAGKFSYFGTETPPVGWLRCNGALVSRTAYPDLFAAIGTRWGAGDGTTTFRLPDGRGEFIRGWDDGRGVDAGRVLGSYQSDELKSHYHMTPTADGQPAVSEGGYEVPTDAERFGYDYGFSAPVTATGGSETRPRNIALLMCIKY